MFEPIDSFDMMFERARLEYEDNTPLCAECGSFMERETDIFEIGCHRERDTYWVCPNCGCTETAY